MSRSLINWEPEIRFWKLEKYPILKGDILLILSYLDKYMWWNPGALSWHVYFISDENEEQVFAKFMRAHKCYDLIPTSAKLVIFDTQLNVSVTINHTPMGAILVWIIWNE